MDKFRLITNANRSVREELIQRERENLLSFALTLFVVTERKRRIWEDKYNQVCQAFSFLLLRPRSFFVAAGSVVIVIILLFLPSLSLSLSPPIRLLA